VALEEVATIERTGVDPTLLNEETPYIGLEHIEAGGRLLDVKPVSNGELKSTKFAFGPDHILYGKLRPYLAKIALPEFEGICSTDILPILPGRRINRNYLCQFLRQPRMIDYAASRAEGANLPRLSPKALAKFEIPLPPLAEQKRIAAILDKADQLRQKRRQAIALLDSLTQSIFLEMFGDPVSNPSNLPLIEFGSLIVRGPTNGLYKPASAYGIGTKILRINNFYDGAVTEIDQLRRLQISAKERETYGLAENEIVINRVNSREYLGKSALIPNLDEPVVFESNMMRLAVNEDLIDPKYCIDILQSGAIKRQIAQKAKDAVNQSSINQTDVKTLIIMLPPIAKQKQYAKIASACANRRQALNNSLTHSDRLFASLQHCAFTGQL
jgi:type I restriction enzyme S subunit